MIWHWLTTDSLGQFVLGVIGNLTASAVLFVFGGRWVWKRHLKDHIARVKDLHANLEGPH